MAVCVTSLKSAILVGAVAALASCSGPSTPSSPAPLPDQTTPMLYTAIGASDVTGIGASSPCLDPFAECPASTGYVFVATRQLRAKGYTVTLANLGLPTAVIGPDFQALATKHNHFVVGNFIENEAPVVNSKTTLVTIFAGANDVNVVTGAMGGGEGASDPVAYINTQIHA